jgi:hypothetical protein
VILEIETTIVKHAVLPRHTARFALSALLLAAWACAGRAAIDDHSGRTAYSGADGGIGPERADRDRRQRRGDASPGDVLRDARASTPGRGLGLRGGV